MAPLFRAPDPPANWLPANWPPANPSAWRRAGHRSMVTLAVSLLTFVTSGATCMPKRTIPEFQPQIVFQNQPSTEQLLEVLNRAQGIQSLQSNFVTVNPNKIRNLDATLVWQRERRFRMAGGISRMLGNNFEVGSNDEWFWMSVRDGGSPQLYVARHDEFDAQANRRILPISPLWIVEALGVVSIDSAQLLGEPRTRPDGQVEIHSLVPSPTGAYTRTLVVDVQYGYSRQILLRDPSGRLVATANQMQHEFYPSISMALPHRVVIQLTPALDPPTEIDITVGKYSVNQLDPNTQSGYELPNPAGFEVVNLVQFNEGMPQAVTPVQVSPPNTAPQSAFRGVPWDEPLLR